MSNIGLRSMGRKKDVHVTNVLTLHQHLFAPLIFDMP